MMQLSLPRHWALDKGALLIPMHLTEHTGAGPLLYDTLALPPSARVTGPFFSAPRLR